MRVNGQSVASISAVISENEAILALVTTKGDHRVDSRRTPRRNVSGQQTPLEENRSLALAGTDTNRKLHPLLDIADKT